MNRKWVCRDPHHKGDCEADPQATCGWVYFTDPGEEEAIKQVPPTVDLSPKSSARKWLEEMLDCEQWDGNLNG
jgi:hypothetical protein